MSEQDGAQATTKKHKSRQASSKQNSTQEPALQHPANDDKEAWKAYWEAHGQSWRSEPEIDTERQKFLDERRRVPPDIKQGIYPLKDIEPKLTRADVEWLLATHENGRGPVEWSDENQRDREGLDLRAADVRSIDLHDLPLARLRGGLSRNECFSIKTAEERYMAGLHLEGANLSGAHLEGTDFYSAHLVGQSAINLCKPERLLPSQLTV
jgi:hypothetical protein